VSGLEHDGQTNVQARDMDTLTVAAVNLRANAASMYILYLCSRSLACPNHPVLSRSVSIQAIQITSYINTFGILFPCLSLSVSPSSRCIQDPALVAAVSQIMSVEIPVPEMSEDCLYLNVYTPAGAVAGDKLPVGQPSSFSLKGSV